jgi:L-galactose dehydrogenase
MDTAILGRTGLKVSVAALGAGGSSRLGLRTGASETEAVDLVRAAIDRGINFIDTAPAYGTESVVGQAIRNCRDKIIVSTKVKATLPGASYEGADFVKRGDITRSVEKSLAALRTDHIDLIHLHGVRPHHYEFCLSELLPELLQVRDAGKVRFLGITEAFGTDPSRQVMQRAIGDGVWDVIMLGHNFVNQSAMQDLLPRAAEANLGVMAMYAVRGALARKDRLDDLVTKLIDLGEIDPQAVDTNDPYDLLLEPAISGSLTETAYRFCRHSLGVNAVLTGTGNLKHLDDNIAAINGKPLPENVLERLSLVFGGVRSATGDIEVTSVSQMPQ